MKTHIDHELNLFAEPTGLNRSRSPTPKTAAAMPAGSTALGTSADAHPAGRAPRRRLAVTPASPRWLTRLRRRMTLIAVPLVVGLGTSQASLALTTGPLDSDQLAAQASFIFDGTVTAVKYRVSDVGTPDQIALPHTFVTFNVNRSFKGRSPSGKSVTLRFQGGPDGAGSLLLIPGIPMFDVGQRAILYVRDNNQSICPLVGCEQGRLRVVGDSLYTDDGAELYVTTSGRWLRGSVHVLPEMTSHNVDGTVLGIGGLKAQRVSAPSSSDRLSGTGFGRYLTARLPTVATMKGFDEAQTISSAEIEEPFYVQAARAVAPPRIAGGQSANMSGPADEDAVAATK